MDQVPDFWRTEVWHPLSVHFPIALLIFGTLSYIIALMMKGERWFFMAKILLLFGVLGAWLAIYTGNMADGVVSRHICDPTVLKDHEISAYVLSILFSISVILLFVFDLNLLSFIKKSQIILKILWWSSSLSQ